MNSERIKRILELRNKRSTGFEAGKYKDKSFEEVFTSSEGRRYMRYVLERDQGEPSKMRSDLLYWLESKAEKEHDRTDLKSYELAELYLPNDYIPQEPGQVKFKFGKHRGKTIDHVYNEDTKYLTWYVGKNFEYMKVYEQDPQRKPAKEEWFIHQVMKYLHE